MPKSQAAFHSFVVLASLVWLVSFGLSLDSVLGGAAIAPVLITAPPTPGGYPQVLEGKTGLGADEAGLAAGDALVRVGDSDLAGADRDRWRSAFTRLHGRGLEVPIVYERDGTLRETRWAVHTRTSLWPRLVASLAYMVCAAWLLARVRKSPLQRAIVVMNLVVAILLCCFFSGSVPVNRFADVLSLAAGSLVLPVSVRAYLMLPGGVAPRRIWLRAAPWTLALLGPFDLSRFEGWPFSHYAGSIGAAVVSALFVAIVLAAISHSYRKSDRIGRRQLRWVVLGLYLTAVPLALAGILVATRPGQGWLLALAVSCTGILPLSILIAVSRFNFLDVDRVVGATASITLLAGLVIAALVIALPPAAHLLSGAFGIQQATAQFFLIAAMAGLSAPTYWALRAPVDRVFFASRQALERGIVELNRDLSHCRTIDEVWQTAGERLVELFRPESGVLYVRSAEVLEPIRITGALELPRFAIASPLLAAVEEHPGPLSSDSDRGSAIGGSLGPFQRAVLDTLQVPLVVPVRSDQGLAAFLCLGEKASGDVYTPSDLALLSLVADKIVSELQRFAQQDQIHAGRVLRDRLRAYVPGPLVERLDRGEELTTSTAEVSILFVDIRGFSAYSESLTPREIFDTVNRYTEIVSAILADHGGTVVEFNGDGMMAVFGAPRALPHKEQAAVAAGRAIVARVPELSGSTGTLSAGVGVATGDAFVGSVHAVDRLIWTALGNTTNLASRLQSLTRDYDAAMVIDEATWRNAGPEVRSFWDIGDGAIRGLRQTEHLYALPRPLPA